MLIREAKMNISEIKKYMKANKITQIELSEKSGIPLQTLRGIFSGKTQNPRIDTMQAIENALEIESTITAEERAAGASTTKKISITPIEDEMLYLFREVGKKHGEEVQRAIITTTEKML